MTSSSCTDSNDESDLRENDDGTLEARKKQEDANGMGDSSVCVDNDKATVKLRNVDVDHLDEGDSRVSKNNDKDDVDVDDDDFSDLESGRFHLRLDQQSSQPFQNEIHHDDTVLAATEISASKPSISPSSASTIRTNRADDDHRPRVRFSDLPYPTANIGSSDAEADSILADHEMEMSDSEDGIPKIVDQGWELEQAIRKSIFLHIAGGTGVGILMSWVTMLVKCVSKLLGAGDSPAHDVAHCLAEDPADTLLIKGMVQNMSVHAAQNAGSFVASATSASTSTTMTTSMAVGMTGTVPSSTPGTLAVLAVTAATATWAAIHHGDDPSAVVVVLNATQLAKTTLITPGICNNSHRHELKQGNVRFGLSIINTDILTLKQGELERLFDEVYLNITGGCEGFYERLLQRANISSYDFPNSDSSLVDSNNSLLTVYTSWEASVGCSGCLDYEPLFTSHNESLLSDVQSQESLGAAVDTHQIDGNARNSPAGNGDLRNRHRRVLFNGNSAAITTDCPQLETSTNTLFRQFVITYGVQVSREVDGEVTLFYAALLSPEGKLVEEVCLRNQELPLIEEREAVPAEPRMAPSEEEPIPIDIKKRQSPTPFPNQIRTRTGRSKLKATMYSSLPQERRSKAAKRSKKKSVNK